MVNHFVQDLCMPQSFKIQTLEVVVPRLQVKKHRKVTSHYYEASLILELSYPQLGSSKITHVSSVTSKEMMLCTL